MICSNLAQLTGLECVPLAKDGSLALIKTPFTFADGSPISLFTERVGEHVRFFDDGLVLFHFIARGLKLPVTSNPRFLMNIAESTEVNCNDEGVLEVLARADRASEAFAKFTSCMLKIVEWEQVNTGLNSHAAYFVEEVTHALRSWRHGATIAKSPIYTGSSGKKHTVDFMFNDEGVMAITPHPNAAAAALHKLIDIQNASANSDQRFLIVIDDRSDARRAHHEFAIFEAVTTTVMYSRLAKLAEPTEAGVLH